MLIDIHSHTADSRNAEVVVFNQLKDFGNVPTSRFSTMGLHPWYIDPATFGREMDNMRQNCQRSSVIAIGECGLDKLSSTDWSFQKQVFEEQISLAVSIDKPLIIHCVRAYQEILSMVKGITVPVVFHGTGSRPAVIAPVVRAGHYFSFGKAILPDNASARESLRAVPANRIFFETDDAPALCVSEVYQAASEVLECDVSSLEKQIERNFQTVFGLSAC